ncbi:FkbM family methyltransferase [uncultured Methylophaga sp.]|uniref:FkbM family methyltransferase n=1 Tax=uncultured Methylophaga sp. TaxID=285271 RepID=UPI00260CF099|nr:FkbM family methyltransferase [uncultured Methylophaga sp.]
MRKYINWASKKYSIFISQLQDYILLSVPKPSWSFIPSSVYKDAMTRLNIKNIEHQEKLVSLVILGDLKLFGPRNEKHFTCSKKGVHRTKVVFSSVYGYEIDDAAAALIHNIIYRFVTEFTSYPWRESRTLNLVAGNTFIDIGAFRGYVSVKASRKVGSKGKVISIEPVLENIELIRKNIEINGLNNVELLNGYVAEEGDSKLFAYSNQVNGVIKSNLPDGASELVSERFHISHILDLIPIDTKRVVISLTTNGNEKSILENTIRLLQGSSFFYEIHLPYLFNPDLNYEIDSLISENELTMVKNYPWLSVYKN